MVPFVLASLNNWNVVVVGATKNKRTEREIDVIQIFQYYRQLAREMQGNGDGYGLVDLRSIAVNMKNNDIYVSDRDTGIMHFFKEEGIYISSYSILETIGIWIWGSRWLTM